MTYSPEYGGGPITIELDNYERRNLGLLLWAIMKWSTGYPLMSGDWNGQVLWKLFPNMTMEEIEKLVAVDHCGNASVEDFEKFLKPLHDAYFGK